MTTDGRGLVAAAAPVYSTTSPSVSRRKFFSFMGAGVAFLAKPDLFLGPAKKLVTVAMYVDLKVPAAEGGGIQWYVYLDENHKKVWVKMEDLAKQIKVQESEIFGGVTLTKNCEPEHCPPGCDPRITRLKEES